VQTGKPGVYKFYFQAVGHNARGELAPREATRYLTLKRPEPTPPKDDGGCQELRELVEALQKEVQALRSK
jgi:hypothetical protein